MRTVIVFLTKIEIGIQFKSKDLSKPLYKRNIITYVKITETSILTNGDKTHNIERSEKGLRK